MTRISLTALCLLAAFGLPACKIVKTKPATEAGTTAAATTDEGRMAALVEEVWVPKLVPLLTDRANDLTALRPAIAAGLDAAGKTMGNRGAGEGAAWAFSVKGTGTITAANLESRAHKAEVDTDGDGAADVILQLGPVIKGTALRDAAPFFVFTEFRDQIEFALLARALNDRASAGLVVPEGDLVGQKIDFAGAVSLKSATDPWLITLVALTAAP